MNRKHVSNGFKLGLGSEKKKKKSQVSLSRYVLVVLVLLLMSQLMSCKCFCRANVSWPQQSRKNHYPRTTKRHSHDSNWDFKRKTKTAKKFLDNEAWDFSATWCESRPKLNPFHADFLFTSIIFCFCIWSKTTDVSRRMTSNILQHL